MKRYRNKRVRRNRTIMIVILILFVLFILVLKNTSYIKQIIKLSSDVEDMNLDNVDQDDEKVVEYNGITVVVDPGHGGRDPGKIGVNGALEKDINLSIAMKLKEQLENNGYRVVMTREEDISLSSEEDSKKQLADLRNRVDIINNSNAEMTISIHQNSFAQEDCKGVQVFYFGSSEKSETFAHIMQEQIKNSIQDGNTRKAQAENSYYMLKNTYGIIIIVECGFLSNYEEANLLTQDSYQERMAEAMYLGIETYVQEKINRWNYYMYA